MLSKNSIMSYKVPVKQYFSSVFKNIYCAHFTEALLHNNFVQQPLRDTTKKKKSWPCSWFAELNNYFDVDIRKEKLEGLREEGREPATDDTVNKT